MLTQPPILFSNITCDNSQSKPFKPGALHSLAISGHVLEGHLWLQQAGINPKVDQGSSLLIVNNLSYEVRGINKHLSDGNNNINKQRITVTTTHSAYCEW